MNKSIADQPGRMDSPRVPLGFPFVVIAAWLCAVAIVTLAREASLMDSQAWRHYGSAYDVGSISFGAILLFGLFAGPLGVFPLAVWLGRNIVPTATRRRWLHAGAVTLLVATLLPVARTAALVSQADRLLRRPSHLYLVRLAPYASQDLMYIGCYCVFLLVPGGLGYGVGWAARTAPHGRMGERNP